MKNWCLCIIMLLFFANCSELQMVENISSSKDIVLTKTFAEPHDSITSLLHQARWGDGKAYLKLADCYRDGFGVKKDFLGMIIMAEIAEKRGGIRKTDDYISDLPDGHEYKTLFLLMNEYKPYIQESADSVMQVLRENGSPEAQALLGLVMIDQGDTIAAKNIIEEAANQGCSLAKLLLTVPDRKGRVKADATKLALIAEQIPLAYYILGNLYYEPDDNGKTDKQLAVEYYLKAEEQAVLGTSGAERVLDYYKNGGNIQLTENDIKRLELIVHPKNIETE